MTTCNMKRLENNSKETILCCFTLYLAKDWYLFVTIQIKICYIFVCFDSDEDALYLFVLILVKKLHFCLSWFRWRCTIFVCFDSDEDTLHICLSWFRWRCAIYVKRKRENMKKLTRDLRCQRSAAMLTNTSKSFCLPRNRSKYRTIMLKWPTTVVVLIWTKVVCVLLKAVCDHCVLF